ncbi:heavy metal translocatin [Amylostereum chailletii]|nr:heavy metal translocatin [Amylostereum chailletii]
MSPLTTLRGPPFSARGPSSIHDLVHTASNEHGGFTTTVFISNLHCSSCVQTIEETLSCLDPQPTSVQTSIVSQSVTVQHPQQLSYASIKAAIEDAGFDIATQPIAGPSKPPTGSRGARHVEQCTMCQTQLHPHSVIASEPYTSQSEPEVPPAVSKDKIANHTPCTLTLSVGGMTCASCTSAITNALNDLPGVHDVSVSLLTHSAAATLDDEKLASKVVETIQDIGYDADIVTVAPSDLPGEASNDKTPHVVSLSIGGMTCAACSSTITRLLSDLNGVSDVSINLLGHSGSVKIAHKELVSDIVETIEGAGYEASVMSIEPVETRRGGGSDDGPKSRTISLAVDGMFCQHCPGRIMSVLDQFGSQLVVENPLSERDPVVRLTYVPSPSLTIRSITSAIASAKSPPFKVTSYRPPTLEDRARIMQGREQLHLLYRLVFAIIVAIPTFIIGIVYMSLVPKTNAGKVFLMEPMWTGNVSRIQWSLFFLATPVMFYSAGIFHKRSLKELRALWRRGSKTPVWKRFIRFGSMNLLVSSGVSVAYFSSIALLALAASQPASADGAGDTTTYFDSVVLLTMFLLIGRYMEAYSKSRTADAISDLGKLRPSDAFLLTPVSPSTLKIESTLSFRDGSDDLEKGDLSSETASVHAPSTGRVQRISTDLLEVGDIVRVQNGATPPADGTLIAGETTFDESSLTGESRPIKKTVGDRVFLGTINTSRAVDMRVDAIGGETMLDHVMKVVRDGQTKRAPIERLADLLTGYFVPVVTALAISTWVIWLALGESGALPRDYLDTDVGGWPVWSLKFAIAVFVVACPCGIGLAAPTALLVGSGLAAKFGILARGGGEAFQEAAQLDVIVFDKTGTLTQGGEPSVTDFTLLANADQWKKEVVLGLALEAESASTHPLATAIRRFCETNNAVHIQASSFEEVAGRGLKVAFTSRSCSAVIGNEKWMEEQGITISSEDASRLGGWKSEGKSVVLLAVRSDSKEGSGHPATLFSLAALFAVSDPLRPNALMVIKDMQSRGLETWMISGDNQVTAEAVAKEVGIPASNVIAGVLPHEKAEKVRWLQAARPKRNSSSWRNMFRKRLNERCIVAMVGDGINDAPALASADVAIAIGSGSDVALSSASFILVSSELTGLITLVDLSRTIFRRVKFNFLWAIVYNLAAIPIAAGVIYPAGHARLDPVWGSLAMALSSISVVCSSLLLRLYKAPRSTS